MIKRCLEPPQAGIRTSVGLLAVRLVTGTAFLFHGWSKIQHPTSWMPEDMGYPGLFQALGALSEFGGGAALIMGLLVPLASLGLLCTMTVASYLHISAGDPFVGADRRFEPALVYLSIAFLMLLAGPGRLSLDSWFFRRRDGSNP